jgi:hypothetical protein
MSENADFHTVIRQAVLPLCYGEPHNLQPIGTAFVINAAGKQAIVLTARHNLERIHSLQNPHPRHHPSTPIFLRAPEQRRIKLDIAEVLLPVTDPNLGSRGVARIFAGYGCEGTDVAILFVELKEDRGFRFTYQIALDPAPLAVGEQLIVGGYKDMKVDHSIDPSTDVTAAAFSYKYIQSQGEVILAEKADFRLIKWAAARTNIPLSSGMSGGPAFSRSLWEKTLTARAMICSDMSEDGGDMRSGSGTASFVTELWPALHTEVSANDPKDNRTREWSLLQMIDEGIISHEGDVLEKYYYLCDVQTRERKIGWGVPSEWYPVG